MKTVDLYLREKARRTEEAMEQCIAGWGPQPERLIEAIRYSLFAPAKRLRPALALGAAEIVCGDDTPALPAACALEMIHTYSLIHDDLPAMDNDDLRRGRPTSHKVFGEATAMLAGDTLLTMAFDAAAQSGNIRIIRELAQAAGVGGMAGGQFYDIEAEGRQVTLEELRQIHALKTGALIRASVRCGAMLAGAEAAALDALTRYGEQVGLAFQIADDILNVKGTQEAIGKPVGSDASRKKSTYPALVGLDRARKLAEEAVAAAVAALEIFGEKADMFSLIARFIVERDR